LQASSSRRYMSQPTDESIKEDACSGTEGRDGQQTEWMRRSQQTVFKGVLGGIPSQKHDTPY